MNTDLITVQEDDILDLPASLMDWRRIRHVAVEDKAGKLVGLITSRMLLRNFARRQVDHESLTVSSVMRRNPVSISPGDSIVTAMRIMRQNQIGCLPVLNKGKLIGMITEAEFLEITSTLMNRMARRNTIS